MQPLGTDHTLGVAIRPAAVPDSSTLGEVLGRAFHDDPVFTWILPAPASRSALLPLLFAGMVEAYLPLGETYKAGDGAGGAVWVPPGSDPFPEEEAELFAAQMVVLLGDDAAHRFLQVSRIMQQHHPVEPCFYLLAMGVRPDRQGRGLGGRLLDAVTRRCDATGVPAYLEATSDDNRRLYERHGFDTVTALRLPQGPPLWPMWREAGHRPAPDT
jgi:GNAT superfamily N-acetyltransferase